MNDIFGYRSIVPLKSNFSFYISVKILKVLLVKLKKHFTILTVKKSYYQSCGCKLKEVESALNNFPSGNNNCGRLGSACQNPGQ